MYYDFFPKERVELQREILHHPKLLELLAQLDANADFCDRLLQIATYCNILIDGDYTQEDLNRVCEACTTRLRERRTSFILPYNTAKEIPNA